ncbi:cupin domain-containing protein [Couchioplanes caeruleus]|uniref:Cupin n=2 Tax=Couchioplanes caeruleus TaxID=56438 RepID=A0A1K0FBT2_9ACTN|nr:cupin domain-containing protein [Couchioplanes caeruleus]OJF10303.1 cupin [Couchioplanes caeruleus subsp. caeruleus]ROP34241.1 cupin superfamily protein [Couchioplanes caeruleus]
MTNPSPDGTGDRPALGRVVAVDPDKFAEAYWGRQPLLTRADELAGPDGFRDLLSPEAVDELLSERGLRTPFLRVANQGTVLPASAFTASGGAGAEIADQVADDKIMRLYADGATLVLQGLHRLWPPLIRYAGRLGEELRQPLQVNAYLTPAGNKGFATHYDTHDVFVLQVDGTKRWRIHEPVLPEPLERQAWGGRADEVDAVAEGPAALDVVLAPGDALYLPRGWLHSARAQGERSLHLTFGVRALTRYAIVEELLTLAARNQRLRATLPYRMDVADAGQVAPELTETVAVLREWLLTAEPAEIAERLRERAWPAKRPAPVRPLAQLAHAEGLGPGGLVTVREGLRWDLSEDGPDHVVLRLTGRTLRLPAYCAPAVRTALDGRTHRVGDLPGLDDDADRLVLARRLLREAVLVPA